MLNLGVVTSLLKSMERYVADDMMLLDIDGRIIAGPNRSRRGMVHALARRLLDGVDEQVIVQPDDANQMEGSEVGVYVTLNANQTKMGVLAVLGTGESAVSMANIMKICMEKTLEAELYKRHLLAGNEQQIHNLIYSSNTTKDDIDWLVRIKHIHPDLPRVPILLIVHHDTTPPTKMDVELVKHHIAQSQAYSATDLLCRTMDNNVMWFKTIATGQQQHAVVDAELLRQDIETAMKALNHTVFSAYVGPVQNKLQNYNMSYRQCEWMRVTICVAGIYFFNHYLLSYLSSKVSRAEYVTIFSAVCHEIDAPSMHNFCEMMEALIQCDYNFAKVSERLYIHKNTALYRFNKIRNLFGMNPLTNNNERNYLETLYHYCKAYPASEKK